MKKLLRSLGALVGSAALILTLGFGLQEARASADGGGAMIGEGTCPNEFACALCCIQHNGNNGVCFGTTCICIH